MPKRKTILQELAKGVNGQYILVDGKPVAEPDVLAWGKWLQGAKRHVAQDMVGDVRVSTVFLGLDHDFSRQGPPVLWETMVFGGELDQEMDRYCSEEDARKGHAAMLARVKATIN